MAIQKITLDINQPKSSVSANVQQYDVGTRTLVIELTEDGIPYIPEEGTTALLEYVKPDNKKILEEYSISGNTISIEMTEQMMCVPGICFGRIELIQSGTSLHTVIFKVRVYKGLIQTAEIVSSTEYNALVYWVTEAKKCVVQSKQMLEEGNELIENLKNNNLPVSNTNPRDIFSIEEASNTNRLYTAMSEGGIWSGYNKILLLDYNGEMPSDDSASLQRCTIFKGMNDFKSDNIIIKDITLQPEGDMAIAIEMPYIGGSIEFNNVTFINIGFYLGLTYPIRLIFRDCKITDTQYVFLLASSWLKNAEIVIEDCEFIHQRPNLEEYRADIGIGKKNGWAYGWILSWAGYTTWRIKRTIFSDSIGGCLYFASPTAPEEVYTYKDVHFYMEDCLIEKTSTHGFGNAYMPMTGWIKNCKFIDLGANRCNGEGYDLKEDYEIQSGTGTNEDPYIYKCGVGTNAIFTENGTSRHDMVISGNYIYNSAENGIEGNYAVIEGNHIENMGYRLEEGIYNPSMEGIYATAYTIRNNTIINPQDEYGGIVIPQGIADNIPITVEKNYIFTDRKSRDAGIRFAMVNDKVGFSRIDIRDNVIIGFMKKYLLWNIAAAELKGIHIYETGHELNNMLYSKDSYNNYDLWGVDFDGESNIDITKNKNFLTWKDGLISDWDVQYGIAKLYKNTGDNDIFLRVTPTSYTNCSVIRQFFSFSDDLYIARVKIQCRSLQDSIGIVATSLDSNGDVPSRYEGISFSSKFVEMKLNPYQEGFTEAVCSVLVTSNFQICIVNPFVVNGEGETENEISPYMDIKNVEITLLRAEKYDQTTTDEVIEITEPDTEGSFDFTKMPNVFVPSTVAKVTAIVPGFDYALTLTPAQAIWYMITYTSPESRGEIILDSDMTLYSPVSFYDKCYCDFNMNGHTITYKATEQTPLVVYNGADVRLTGNGNIIGQDYAVSVGEGSSLIVTNDITISSTNSEYCIGVGKDSSLVLEGGTVGGVFGNDASTIVFDVKEGCTITMDRMVAKGGITIYKNNKVNYLDGAGISYSANSIKTVAGMGYCTKINSVYEENVLAEDIIILNDKSLVEWNYTDADGKVHIENSTLKEAFEKAINVYDSLLEGCRFVITMLSDSNPYIGYALEYPAIVTLNLNGHKIENNYDSYSIKLNDGVDMLITDSIEGETGGIISNSIQNIFILGENCHLTIDSGKIKSNVSNNVVVYFGANLTIKGTAVIESNGNSIQTSGANVGTKGNEINILGGSIMSGVSSIQFLPGDQENKHSLTISGNATINNTGDVGDTIIENGDVNITFLAEEGKIATITGGLRLSASPVFDTSTSVKVDGVKVDSILSTDGVVTIEYDDAQES